ncbi:MFS transporter [Candidatus Nomurabacteria bacterium]|nr:MFS transporter [Candidatus Nomurabacteria bacterium]
MRTLRPIFLAAFFFSLHIAIVSYINSSMLGSVLQPKAVSFVFALGSLLSILLIHRSGVFIRRFGNFRSILTLFGLSALLLCGIGVSNGHWTSILLFIPYFALNSLVYYSFDVFIEHLAGQKKVGNTRGLFLTLNNLAWVGMPVLAGALEGHYGFGIVYFFAACAVVSAFLIIAIGERGYRDAPYTQISFSHLFLRLRKRDNVRHAIIINFFLQLFYVWMVIYSPLYLTRVLGFSWEAVGGIFSVMLIPFVLLQYPAGRAADRFSNERILIAGGFLTAGVATLIFSLTGEIGAVAVALILFLTRVGASIIEVANESYFFKTVEDDDTPTIALFRNMVPLAYLVGPMLGIILLGWNMYATLFFILGIIMLGMSLFTIIYSKESATSAPIDLDPVEDIALVDNE